MEVGGKTSNIHVITLAEDVRDTGKETILEGKW